MLRSRSVMESHLYMRLHPCTCGETEFPWTRHGQAIGEDGVSSVYEGYCPRCGQERSFEFLLGEEFVPPPAFGARRASEIIDPSDFLRLAQGAAQALPPSPDGLSRQQRDDALDAVETAAAALDEVLKFVPPGARAVPRESFLTEAGRADFDARPAAYALDSLLATRRSYGDLLARLG